MKLLSSILSILVVGLFIAGCSSSPDQQTDAPGDAASAMNPCSLVTVEEVQHALGSTLKLDYPNPVPNQIGQTICFYDSVGDSMEFVQISLIAGDYAKSTYFDSKELVEEFSSVDDLGDDSYYGGSGLKYGAGLHTYVEKQGIYLNINVGLGFQNDDKDAHLAAEKSLMEKALTRL